MFYPSPSSAPRGGGRGSGDSGAPGGVPLGVQDRPLQCLRDPDPEGLERENAAPDVCPAPSRAAAFRNQRGELKEIFPRCGRIPEELLSPGTPTRFHCTDYFRIPYLHKIPHT